MSKKVKINCRGADKMTITALEGLQGDLKTLSDENYKRFKTQIQKFGFIEPVSIWVSNKDHKTYILNGHQRVETLRRMKKEGWSIPQIPVNVIEATDLKDAKKKLLALASQYGKLNKAGFADFISDLDMSKDFIDKNFFFDGLDLGDISFEEETTTVSEHERKNSSKELGAEEFEDFQHQCPKCGFEWGNET